MTDKEAIEYEILIMSICDRIMSQFTIWQRIWLWRKYCSFQKVRLTAENKYKRLIGVQK